MSETSTDKPSLVLDIPSFASNVQEFIELERLEEISKTRDLLRKESPKSLEWEGIALINMRIVESVRGLYGRQVLTMSKPHNTLPYHKFSPGDVVGLAPKSANQGKDSMDTVLRGIVYHVMPTKIVVAITLPNENASDILEDTNAYFTLLQLGNDVTFKRMESALDKLAIGLDKNALPVPVEALFEDKYDSYTQSTQPLNLVGKFNESQVEAIQYALDAPNIALIHGPPGTGKTTTVVELIYHATLQGKKVLACAASNIAVDNLVERLVKYKIPIVRIGHPARMLETTLLYCLDDIYLSSNEYEVTTTMRKDMKKLEREIANTSNGFVRKQMWKEWRDIKSDLKKREIEGLKRIVQGASVVLSTCTGADDRTVRDANFDMVVIDEAGQCIDPILLIPAFKGRKVVLAGDHLQLPPTVKSTVASEKGLCTTTFFERIMTSRPEISRMLTVQYRMNQMIMRYSSDALYNSRLIAADSVKHHLLSDLGSLSVNDEDRELLEHPVIFIDTAGCDMLDTGGQKESKHNEGEAMVVVKVVKKLLKMGLPPSDIGVISPYNAQVELIRGTLKSDNILLEVHSVDGFQGREKEAIIFSFVRSNPDREVGFLKSYNRINVAITRAKRLLVAVGDSETISVDPFIKNFVQYCENECEYWSAEEFRDQDTTFNPIETQPIIPMSPEIKIQEPKKMKPLSHKNHPKKAKIKAKKVSGKAIVPAKSSDNNVMKPNENPFDMNDEVEAPKTVEETKSVEAPKTLKVDDSELKTTKDSIEELPLEEHRKDKEIKSEVTKKVAVKKVPPKKPKSNTNAKKTSTTTKTPVKKPQTKSQKAIDDFDDEDALLDYLLEQGSKCSLVGCNKSTRLLNDVCKFCKEVFCFTHSQPEIHGCGDEATRQGRQQNSKIVSQMKSKSYTPNKKPTPEWHKSALKDKLHKKIEGKENKRKKVVTEKKS